MQSADTRPLLFQRVLNKLAQAGKNNRVPPCCPAWSLVFSRMPLRLPISL